MDFVYLFRTYSPIFLPIGLIPIKNPTNAGNTQPMPSEASGSCITFYHKQTLEQEGHGVLFFLDCYPGEWSTENPPVIAGNSVVVLKTAENTFGSIM